ncbi:glycosyltransferase family 4 protein [Candidatus Kaiserbacteria bacterium]|nr:glycosyltransferase family 4 protein [Candidatus Kaiserbacteria bacterium]
MEKKRLLYVITKSQFGGAQRYVFELASALKGDYDVSVACGGSGELVQKLQHAHIPVIPLRHIVRDMSLFKEIRAFSEIKRIIKEENPDVVHLNSSKAGVLGALAARLVGIKHVVFTAHGWPFLEKRNVLWKTVAWIGSWVTALLSHKVIVVSRYDRDHMHMPFVRDVKVIHTAVPPVAFLPRATARLDLLPSETVQAHRDDTWLGTIAELTPNKNLFAAIDAVGAYNKAHTKKIFYTIIGSGELIEALAQYIERHDLTDHVKLVGYVDSARKYLAAFDLFVLPSKKEGFPYALLEAGSAGIPVIASNVGGIPELIKDKKTGLLMNPADANTLLSALGHAIENPDQTEKYAAALIECIEKHHALPVMITKTAVLYSA